MHKLEITTLQCVFRCKHMALTFVKMKQGGEVKFSCSFAKDQMQGWPTGTEIWIMCVHGKQARYAVLIRGEGSSSKN